MKLYPHGDADMWSLPQEYIKTSILMTATTQNGVYRSSKQELYEPHGGFTYIDEGIPGLEAVHGDYLGWDYNHFGDHTGQPTVEEIFREGRKVIDSMLAPKSTG